MLVSAGAQRTSRLVITEGKIDKQSAKLLTEKLDPYYERVVAATSIVKDFIREKGLIIYGGTAIDMALRLYGEKIYPDEMLLTPDLDFYSPDSVGDSYILADKLYGAGYTQARVIRARYVRAMKVDIGDNHFIADISYMPSGVFSELPTIVFDNMRCIHPLFQRIDVHNSLSFPFDGPPLEVIFSRWKKDVERFSLMARLYPLGESHRKEATATGLPLRVEVPIGALRYIPTGFLAYAFFYRRYVELMTAAGREPSAEVIKSEISVDGKEGKLIFSADEQLLEFVSTDPEEVLTEGVNYHQYVGAVPPRREGNLYGCKCIVYSTKYRLLSVVTTGMPGLADVTIPSVQQLLRHFLARGSVTSPYYSTRGSAKSTVYISVYNSLMKMIEDVKAVAPSMDIFRLSIEVYGSVNKSDADIVSEAIMYHTLKGAPMPVVPQNYKPSTGAPHPTFDYSASEYFHEDGSRM